MESVPSEIAFMSLKSGPKISYKKSIANAGSHLSTQYAEGKIINLSF